MIEIWFFKGISFTSKIIKTFTWSDYSHVAVVFKPENKILESWWKNGTNILNINEIQHKPGTEIDIYVPKYSISISEQRELLEFSYKIFDKTKYDIFGVIGIALRKDIDKKDRWFCSEATLFLFNTFNFKLLETEPYKTTPGLLSWSPMLKFKETIKWKGSKI